MLTRTTLRRIADHTGDGTGFPITPRDLVMALLLQRTQCVFGPKVKSTGLFLGGKIKTVVPDCRSIEFVGPEPGVEYGFAPDPGRITNH